jgi:hypothetical protein
MNAPLRPDLLLPAPLAQSSLPLATAGMKRIVWAGRYGEMLIEVCGGRVRVNGDWVDPAGPAPLPWREPRGPGAAGPAADPAGTASAGAASGRAPGTAWGDGGI